MCDEGRVQVPESMLRSTTSISVIMSGTDRCSTSHSSHDMSVILEASSVLAVGLSLEVL